MNIAMNVRNVKVVLPFLQEEHIAKDVVISFAAIALLKKECYQRT